MIAKYLWEIGSIIMVVMGIMHLHATFFTNEFSSRNEKMVEDMKTSFPIFTEETTMWKAWIGFHAAFSNGVIFIGIINFYLAVQYFTVLQSDYFFFLFNILTLGFYVWIAKKYWFKTPFIGALMVLICFIASYILIMINK